MSDSRNLFLFSQRKWRERLGGGGQIYWTYSLLVPKSRHRELALKKVKNRNLRKIRHLAMLAEGLLGKFRFCFSECSPGPMVWRQRA